MRPYGISPIWKKMAKNLHRLVKWGTKIIGLRISIFFGKKVTDTVTSLTTTLIWRPLYKLSLNFNSLLLSQYCRCLLCLSHSFARQTSGILQSFEPRLFQSPRMFQHGGKTSISVRFLIEQSVPISSNTFCGTPFLKKGPPKITEQGALDPHWPISRINPEHVYTNWEHIQKNWDDWTQNILSSHVTVLTKRVKKQRFASKDLKRFVDHLQKV